MSMLRIWGIQKIQLLAKLLVLHIDFTAQDPDITRSKFSRSNAALTSAQIFKLTQCPGIFIYFLLLHINAGFSRNIDSALEYLSWRR